MANYLIAGLGNPGSEYENTRHNMGFKAVDKIASSLGVTLSREKFHSKIAIARIDGDKIILIKPTTYMNRSGIAVRETAMYYDIDCKNLIVIYDDLDLPVGSLRIRKSGSAGTHNGMKSVVEQLGIKTFPRIRIGVGSLKNGEDIIDRVIGKVPQSEMELLEDTADKACKAAMDIIKYGIDKSMNSNNYMPDKVE